MLGLLAISLPSGLAAGLAVAFLAGAVSFLSPCVLPLVPSYLSLMSGVGASELAVATKVDQRKLLRSILLFVAGYTDVFTHWGPAPPPSGRSCSTTSWGSARSLTPSSW